MAIVTEGTYLADLVKRESDLGNEFSREKVTIRDGESLSLGSVIGKITKSTPTTGTAGGTNTGDGTCTGVTAGAKAQIGTYTLTCTAAATNAGTFQVKSPGGEILPPATVGVAYTNEHINFTLNDGATDFAVGDSFTIAVAAGSGKCVEVEAAAVDGSQDAYGFVIAAYAPSGADMYGVAIVRDAVIDPAYLAWPAGATAGQKAAWLAQLKDKGILSDRPVA